MDPALSRFLVQQVSLGRRIVWRLHRLGSFIGSRQGTRIGDATCSVQAPLLEAIADDIRNTRSVIDAVTGAHDVVNAISVYIERGTETFRTMHVDCAERVAVEAN